MIKAYKPENEGDFEKTPSGSFQAVCYAVWDLGYQKVTWDGQEKKQHKVAISWEINKTIQSEGEYKGKRFVISNRYTLSLGDKANLRKLLEGWFSKSFKDYEKVGFDLEQLIGKNCLIGIVHTENKGKTYANVSTVIALPEGSNPMIAENNTDAPKWVQKIQSEAVNNEPAIKCAVEQDIASEFDAINAEQDIEVPFS